MQTRDYQTTAISRAIAKLDTTGSAVVVLPTGTGKTVVFCQIASHYLQSGRVLILAHREELIFQAAAKVQQLLGINAGIFMGAKKRNVGSRVVCASILSIINHLDRFNHADFSLLIVDEAHHSCSDSYKRVIKHFQGVKLLGVTATPDRGDNQALGQVYKTVAMDYNIKQAMSDGWLVPISTRRVKLPGLDLRKVSMSGEDLSAASLDKMLALEKNLSKVVSSSIFYAEERKKILVFTAGVAQAKAMTNRLNRENCGRAEFIHAETPASERRQILEDFTTGKIRWLCNCGILTEGYDCPAVDCVVMARPTYSRGLYVQMIGRGLRPAVRLDEVMGQIGRRNAIAASGKPNCLIIDYTDNADNHKLVKATDIFGGLMDKPPVGKANSAGGEMMRSSNQGMWEGHGMRKFTASGYAVRSYHDAMRIKPEKVIAVSRIFHFFKAFLGIK
jgi:superfamily II DNA or RNA helicase